MSTQKDRQPFPINETDFDPAVRVAIGEPNKASIYEGIQRARTRTPAQRKKAQRDKARHRIMIDLPINLDDVLEMLSLEESTSKSQMIAYILTLGLQKLQASGYTFGWAKAVTQAFRFEYQMILPPIPDELLERVMSFRKSKEGSGERNR